MAILLTAKNLTAGAAGYCVKLRRRRTALARADPDDPGSLHSRDRLCQRNASGYHQIRIFSATLNGYRADLHEHPLPQFVAKLENLKTSFILSVCFKVRHPEFQRVA